jgi:hypothetical protein
MRSLWLKYVRATAATVLAIALAGCVSVTPEGERVRVTRNANDIRDCRSLGQGFESTLLAAGGLGFDRNKTRLQNWAAARGADTLLLTSERGGSVSQTFAEAYRCQQ